jgi:5-methylcytosine-specific restriction endonuclease McrA
MVMKALLLDSSYFPVEVIDWKRAMVLFLGNRAEVLDSHDNINIRSTSLSFKLPKVLRLFTNFKKGKSEIKFSRHNIFLRDNWTCQYCLGSFHAQELTLDHVIPRSRGGKTNWENIVSSCYDCNNKKADYLPHEINMKPHKKPVKPNFSVKVVLRLKDEEAKIFSNWLFNSLKAS